MKRKTMRLGILVLLLCVMMTALPVRAENSRITNLHAEAVDFRTAIQVSWTHEACDGYAIWRQKWGETGLELAGTTPHYTDVTEQSFTDPAILEPNFYFYWIQPYNYGPVGPVFDDVQGYAYAYTTPHPLDGLKVEKVEGVPMLSWYNVMDAQCHRIFRKSPQDTKVKPIAIGWSEDIFYKDYDAPSGLNVYTVYPAYKIRNFFVYGKEPSVVYTIVD